MPKPSAQLMNTLFEQMLVISEQTDHAAAELSQLKACAKRLEALQAKVSAALGKRDSRVAEIIESVATGVSLGVAAAKLRVVEKSTNSLLLKLQMQMQRENQIFTSVSNILKTRHDTVKNTIGNVR